MTTSFEQKNHLLTLKVDGDSQKLMVEHCSVSEAISANFKMQIQCVSKDSAISPASIIGKPALITMKTDGHGEQPFHGLVTHISAGTLAGPDLRRYQLVVQPWLWFLTCRRNCKIFQNKSVIEIAEDIFGYHGFSDYDIGFIKATHDKREYCVQYNETDFEFVNRLFEEEGIFYYFTHAESKHMLVLADDKAAYQDILESEVAYDTGDLEEDHIRQWERMGAFVAGKYTHTDYDFEKPSTPLETHSKTTLKLNNISKYEDYQYAGNYTVKKAGQDLTVQKIEAHECLHDTITGAGTCRTFRVGGKFNLKKHQFIGESNQPFVISSVEHYASNSQYVTGTGGQEEYTNQFTCIPAEVLIRPQVKHAKPSMGGPQTAIVVGKSGEEIFTDEYGRIKVQFHWDRDGNKDEDSSCWVRVAQSSAGAKWGAQFIPRMGQEVIVSFINGDPDRPLVTGSVYNAEQMPPYELPANKSQSGIKTRSTKGGSADNFNEIRFEDKKGEEELYIHAEKDNNYVVENDRSKQVGHDQAVSIGNDHSEEIGRNKTIQVGQNHTETIGKDMFLTVGNSRTETITVNHTETVGVAKTVGVGAALTLTVGAAMAETVGGAKTESVGLQKAEVVGGTKSSDIGKDYSRSVGKDYTSTVKKDRKDTIGGKQTTSIKEEMTVNAKKIQLVAKDEIEFKVGKAKIIMKKNGDITLDGGKINIKGSKDIIIKGSQIKEN